MATLQFYTYSFTTNFSLRTFERKVSIFLHLIITDFTLKKFERKIGMFGFLLLLHLLIRAVDMSRAVPDNRTDLFDQDLAVAHVISLNFLEKTRYFRNVRLGRGHVWYGYLDSG